MGGSLLHSETSFIRGQFIRRQSSFITLRGFEASIDLLVFGISGPDFEVLWPSKTVP